MSNKGVNPKSNRVEWLDEDAGILMQEWQVAIYRDLVETTERSLGRQLTNEEARTMHWLSSSDKSTINDIRNFIIEAHKNDVIVISPDELKENWEIEAKDHVGSRIAFHFGSKLFPDVVNVRISVSRTAADPEAEAWKVLNETVK